MEATACNSQIQDSRSATPLQDEEMIKDVPLASLTLERAEYRCPLVDNSIHDKKGMIIQFINTGCPGTSPVIGGIRINLEDIRMVPLYLHQNKALIKQHGARILMDHWKNLNYGMGCLENQTIEDFGIVFTLASVSPSAIRLNPLQKAEGPLFYCHLPALVEPQAVIHADWGTNTDGLAVHLINAYITLISPHQRRNVMIRKEREEKATAVAVAAAANITIPQARPVILPAPGYTGTIPKKPKANSAPSTSGAQSRPAPYPPRSQQRSLHDSVVLREEMSHLHSLINRVQSQIIPSPPLPAPRTPLWPRKTKGPICPMGCEYSPTNTYQPQQKSSSSREAYWHPRTANEPALTSEVT
jgi:hypothetical protein